MSQSDDHDLPRESVVRESAGVELRCRACGATFSRREAATPAKGRIACPACGAMEVGESAPS